MKETRVIISYSDNGNEVWQMLKGIVRLLLSILKVHWDWYWKYSRELWILHLSMFQLYTE